MLRAARNLDSHGLIDGTRSNSVDYPLRVFLTRSTRICVDDFEGDVDVWLAGQHGHVDQSVSVGSAANVAAQSQNVYQVAVGVDVQAVAAAARAVLDALPALRLDEAEAATLKQVAAETLAEAQSAAPDEGWLRELGRRMTVALGTVSTSAAGGTLAGILLDNIHRVPGLS